MTRRGGYCMRLIYEIRKRLEAIGRQRWITVLGVAVAIFSATATQAHAIKPVYGVALTFAATLAAALGKALQQSAQNIYLTYAALAFAVANAITAYSELFGADLLAWAGVATAALAALGRAAFGVDFQSEDKTNDET